MRSRVLGRGPEVVTLDDSEGEPTTSERSNMGGSTSLSSSDGFEALLKFIRVKARANLPPELSGTALANDVIKDLKQRSVYGGQALREKLRMLDFQPSHGLWQTSGSLRKEGGQFEAFSLEDSRCGVRQGARTQAFGCSGEEKRRVEGEARG